MKAPVISHNYQKVYDSFNPIIQSQNETTRYQERLNNYIGDYEIKKTGKYGPYVIHESKAHGITNYLKYKQQKLEDLTESFILQIIEYPKTLGQHKGHDVILQLGPYGVYMKYNNKNYKSIHQNITSLSTVSSLLP